MTSPPWLVISSPFFLGDCLCLQLLQLQQQEEAADEDAEGEEAVLDLSAVQLTSGARVRLLLPQEAAERARE